MSSRLTAVALLLASLVLVAAVGGNGAGTIPGGVVAATFGAVSTVPPGGSPAPPAPPVLSLPATWSFLLLGPGPDYPYTFTGVDPGYSVTNQQYEAFLVDGLFTTLAGSVQPVGWALGNSGNVATLPAAYQSYAWARINYTLNHRIGSHLDVQEAIYMLLGVSAGDLGGVSANTTAMYNAAVAGGGSYLPGTGDAVLVLALFPSQGGLLLPFGDEDSICQFGLVVTVP